MSYDPTIDPHLRCRGFCSKADLDRGIWGSSPPLGEDAPHRGPADPQAAGISDWLIC